MDFLSVPFYNLSMSKAPKRIQLKTEFIAKEQDYFTATESSKFLSITLRQFRTYVANGYIHAIVIGKNHYYKKDDLIALKDKRKPTIEFSPRSFELLLGKVARLTNKLEMIERILDLRYEPLQLDNLQLHALYLAAKERKIDVNTKTIQYWGEVLVRLTEEHFLQLYEFTKDKYCWRPFMELAFLCYGVAKVKDMWALRKLLYMAYKNIRQSTYIYLELFGSKPMTNLIKTGKLKKELILLKKKIEVKKQIKDEDVPTERIEREEL